MKGMKIVSLCVASFSIVACVVATPAAATEGPFYKIGGGVGRLRRGTMGIEVRGTPVSYKIKANIEGTVITVTCTGLRDAPGARINGSIGGNAGTSGERFELTGCTQAGNGAGCSVVGNQITTFVLRNILGYSEAGRKGKIQVLYMPETEPEIGPVVFTGTCAVPRAKLVGSIVGEALSNTATISVGSEPALKEVLEIHFPPALIKKIWIESGGSLKEESINLEWGGKAVTFEGLSEFRLQSRENWGLFTTINKSISKFSTAEWLVGGVAVTSELPTETAGELLFEDTNTVIGKVMILCSALLDGWVGPNSLGWVSEVLNLSDEAISTTPLAGLALECIAQEGCESNSTPKAWPTHLGWETIVELMEQAGTSFTLLSLPHSGGGNPGWEVECLVLGLSSVDECTASENDDELTLEGTSLLAKLSTEITELAEVKLETCSQGGEESGVIEGEGSVALKAGGELTASSEESVS